MSGEKSIEERLARFRADLPRLDPEDMVDKYIMLGDAYVLDGNQHLTIRSEIASRFRISTRDVVVVGSFKTGFSIAPGKRYNPFGDRSDIDVALVSPPL